MKSERPSKVTLEDLLQLKRAERPSAEFWPEFEQELRAKQLAAIVQTRSSWRDWVGRKTLIRLCMPLGAAAVVAMTFSSVRSDGPVATPAEPVVGQVSSGLVAVNSLDADSNAAALIAGEKSFANTEVAVNDGSSSTDEAADVMVVVPARAMQVANTNNATATNFVTRTFDANPVMQVLSEPTLVQMVGRALSVSSQAAASRTPVTEPLAQVATPRDNRRSRLLAYSVSFDPHAADSLDAVRSRDRITHRLSDEAIYDSITRLGLSGDRVSIKF